MWWNDHEKNNVLSDLTIQIEPGVDLLVFLESEKATFDDPRLLINFGFLASETKMLPWDCDDAPMFEEMYNSLYIQDGEVRRDIL